MPSGADATSMGRHATRPRTGIPQWANVLLAAVGMVILSPVLFMVAVGIKSVDGGHILFSQERVGRNGTRFRIWKFRTMKVDGEVTGPEITTAGDARVTGLGRHLRRWKLDELPQLFNVLNGSMSFVGPRPEVPEYVSLYSAEERQVLAVRPGLSDPATLRFRNEEAVLAAQEDPEKYYRDSLMPEKLRMNLEYARCRSVRTDLGVVARTALALFRPGSAGEGSP